MRDVTVENRDGVEILEKLSKRDDYAIYVDPPYGGADTSPYGAQVSDREALAAALRKQQGPVVVSGYGDDWDSLGWQVIDFPGVNVDAAGRTTKRIERCWFNFERRASLWPGA